MAVVVFRTPPINTQRDGQTPAELVRLPRSFRWTLIHTGAGCDPSSYVLLHSEGALESLSSTRGRRHTIYIKSLFTGIYSF